MYVHRALRALLPALFLPLTAVADGTDIAIAGGLTAVMQQELNRHDDDASVSGDLMIDWPVANGGWFLYIEGATGTDADSLFNRYPESNADAGSVLDRNGGGRLQVSELHYRVDFGEHSALTIGQIDASAHLDRSRIANDENQHFLGTSFVNNPTIQFPDYTLGAMYRAHAAQRRPEYTLIVASSDGLADNPGRSYSELINVGDAGKGVFAGFGARWYIGGHRLGLGAWLRTDEQPHLDNPDRESSNHGIYAVYGLQLGDQVISLRAGLANDEVSHAARFASVAMEREFPAGNLGLGFARILEAKRAGHAASGDTNHAEAWFRMPTPLDGLHATGSLQYLANPGFDRSGNIAEAHALLASLRLDYSFQ